MSVFLAPETWPFAVASLLILSIAAIEGIALLIGTSAAGWFDSLLHHSPDALLHHSPDAPDSPDSWLGWLHVGKVPLLVLVILFLALFALVGFALDLAAAAAFGIMVPALIAAPAAAVAAVPLMRVCAGGIAHLIPSDQTYAVSLDTLVGRVAVIVSGTARLGFPAQGKVTSEHGQVHYVMVEPDAAEVTFAQNDVVLLVKRLSGIRFQAIRNPRPDLL
jgi:Protein of unknown function (DUF1449)